MHRTPAAALLVACSIALAACSLSPIASATPSPRAPVNEGAGVVFEGWPTEAHGPAVGAPTNGLPPGFHEAFVYRDLERPTALRFLPDGRVLVSEERGVLLVFPDANTDSPQVLLDHRGEVFMREGSQQGLLGMEIDPDFVNQPYVYLLYTRAAPIGSAEARYGRPGEDLDECADGEPRCVSGARLSRFRFVTPTSLGEEEVLVEDWCSSSNMHSVGAIAFGTDGALLASAGDGAVDAIDYGQMSQPQNMCADPPVAAGEEQTIPDAEGGALHSQDLLTRDDPVALSGALIRVDRATGEPLPDNPLAGDDDANARRIVAYGMRNPFRFVVRPGTTEVWIADVGSQQFEEINVIADPRAGPPANFGWPCFEGPRRHPEWEATGLTLCSDMYRSEPADLRYPAFSFSRAVEEYGPCVSGGSAMASLAFYDGGMFPSEYAGALFMADQQLRCMWVMRAGADGLPDPLNVHQFRVNVAPIDIQIGPDGSMFYVDVDESVHRIYYEGG